ncbi:uncharacterized protein [Cherax quadricarinatus]|uniref:uncharacterized protein isoform X1 n=1 Tax=Cherax quadricarinatus TaxID=27406 RepID=UPI002379D67D|nr:uncharacterized protein LOC128689721 isoform X1 [Cherax quadricarinatus]XP_053634092.1 uncharacterized protein LOC128689721 isoform X1 [Cherax quadricarinatus]
MRWSLRVIVLAPYLLHASTATFLDVDEALLKGGDLPEEQESKVIPQGYKDALTIFGTKTIIDIGVVFGVILLFREFALGIAQRFIPGVGLPDSVEKRDIHGNNNLDDYESRISHSYYPFLQQSLLASGPLLTKVLNSIDPVESTFAVLDVEELACRRRTVCELQRSASSVPLLGYFLKYFSRNVNSLEKYREAQEAGAAFEDCALLFSECPTSLVRTLWSSDQ